MQAAESLAAAVRVHEWEPELVSEGRDRVRRHLAAVLRRGRRQADSQLRRDLRAAVETVLKRHGLAPPAKQDVEIDTTEAAPRIRVKAHEAA